jgi:WD40 repeat protein
MYREVTALAAHEQYGLPVSFTRDGSSLVTGGFDGRVSCWSVPEWAETASIAAHDQSVNCGTVTADGLVATGSTDATVRVLDADLTTGVHTLDGHEKTVAGLASHPTESLLASASYDGTVRLWQLESPADPGVLSGHPKNVTCVEFVDDGAFLVSGGLGDELIVWDHGAESEVVRLEGHGQAVAGLSIAGSGTLWSVGHNGTVCQWATEDWRLRDSFDLPADVTPSGIAVNPHSGEIAVSRDGGVLFLDAEGSPIDEQTTGVKGIYMPRWAPDGSVLAVGGADGTVRIYAPAAGD